MSRNMAKVPNGKKTNVSHRQSGTLHFDATYGWSHKIVTFCTSEYLLWPICLIVVVYSPGGINLMILQSRIII